jgi:hypothetical protein
VRKNRRWPEFFGTVAVGCLLLSFMDYVRKQRAASPVPGSMEISPGVPLRPQRPTLEPQKRYPLLDSVKTPPPARD